MQAEFNALGVDKSRCGKITDETIDFIKSCFASEDDAFLLPDIEELLGHRLACEHPPENLLAHR